MKALSIVTANFCMIALLIGTTTIKATAGDYVGEYCWNFSNSTYGTTGEIRLGFNHIGGNHYLCSGVMSVDDYPFSFPTDGKFATYGNAEFVGNELRLSLSLVGIRNGSVGTEMHTIILDPQTFSGTEKGVGVFYDAVELFDGTLTYKTCQ